MQEYAHQDVGLDAEETVAASLCAIRETLRWRSTGQNLGRLSRLSV